jgi:hypothetical protein
MAAAKAACTLHSPDCPAHDVVHVQPLLAPSVQQPVVSIVVVTLHNRGKHGNESHKKQAILSQLEGLTTC